MTESRIKISSIVENQLPQYVRIEFPLVSEFLSQYYTSIESQGGVSDVLQNIDKYVKVDNLTNLVEHTFLASDITFFDSTIRVSSTQGFPDSYGLLLIDSEIITYTSKTDTTFEGCIRGFSGVTSYREKDDELTFSSSESDDHFATINNEPNKVINLSILFLKEFLFKIKKQFTPGFEDRELYSELNERLFIKQSIDFYSSKGTDNSFKILFGALYGETVEVIKPRDYLIQPSDAQYRRTADLVVQPIDKELDNPERLLNGTLYQDKIGLISDARGTVTKVERIQRGTEDYYILSLDYDYNKDILPVGTVYGEFSIHPKTRLVSSAIVGSTTLEVDSTVAFPEKNGSLVVNLSNKTTLNIKYSTKTLNQFLGCSGITQTIPDTTEIKLDAFAYGYSGIDTSKQERVRILGVLSDLSVPDNTSLYSEGENIKIKTLGIETKDPKFNNWFFNVPTSYKVKEINLLDSSDKSYSVTTYDEHLFKIGIGDSIGFLSSAGDEEKVGNVVKYDDEFSFIVQFGENAELLNEDLTYIARKKLLKTNTENYPSANQYTTNVQNVYYENEDTLYVASPSIPSYLNRPLKIRDRSVTFSGTFEGKVLKIGNHNFYTGDSIVYRPTSKTNNLGISTGVYYIKKESSTEVKIARSKNNIFTEKEDNYVSVNGTVTNAKFELTDFTYRDLTTQLLEPQKIVRKILKPEYSKKTEETTPGLTGIFINGVELLNYKSKDNIFYGPIEEIVTTSPGTGYDVINPPVLTISDQAGFGTEAKAHCSVIGSLERIEILDPGFDYLEDPVITITGGNGKNASAKTKLVSFDHEVKFNSQSNARLVTLDPVNTVAFSEYHKFRDNEEVIYVTNEQSSVGGLSTSSSYFVSIVDAYTVRLHKSENDASTGTNPIPLTSFGIGNHSFRSKNKKKKIGSISVENPGFNYQNKLTIVGPTGINTASDLITIKKHGYQSGEIITYDASHTQIGGLTSSRNYYVTKLNDDQFKLSDVGINTLGISTSFYYDTNQYIDLTSIGVGDHYFNYPKITAKISGRIGVSTISGQDYNAIIRPIFRGEIQSVFVSSGGFNYGSEEIINYNRQPLFDVYSGSGIQLTPIVTNGQITDVIINSPGGGYNSSPNIEVVGDGIGAILTPIFSNGYLIDVKVIYGGIGYKKETTSIIVTSSGKGAKFEAIIKSWKINLVERLLLNREIEEDDGILTTGLNGNYGLQYSHAYAPRNLRLLTQGTSFVDGKKVYSPDLQRSVDGREIESTAHSPIIGWAYDGNPIYGPYGFSSPDGRGSSVKLLGSGYEPVVKQFRPSTSLYPLGFFVEDYVYTGNGDLDEHNGRFEVTPEYPNGIYAYHTTISGFQFFGQSSNYKRPVFPYVIGNTFKSKPIEFNFDSQSNQDFIDINKIGWRRNTTPYNLLKINSGYDYLTNPIKIKSSNSTINQTLVGSIESIGIISGGKNYKIGDRLSFSNVDGNGTKAKVSLLKGFDVNQISVSSSIFENVVFYPHNLEFIGYTSVPHNYNNNDLITITGKYDYKKSGTIDVVSNVLSLISGIGSELDTGKVTYFNVTGNLDYPSIKENDIYQVGNEQIKILNIDKRNSRIRVLRSQNNTVGLSSYSAGFAITEKPRRFTTNFGISTTYNFDLNNELYFNPSESVGIGTTSGVGIVSTITISNPGVGLTQITIPTQSIYIENHNIKTGDSLIYSSNGGTPISVSTNGVSSFQLTDNSIVYATKIKNDLLGISTTRIGLNSLGNYTSTDPNSGLLYFTSSGNGIIHSFKTNYENTLSTQVERNIVTVSTSQTHGLKLLDNITVSVKSGLTTTFVVKYNDINRRLVINPRSFSSINTQNSTIRINDHGYFTGQRVIYTSSSPSVGLKNNGLYYVVVIDSNTIKLSNNYHDALDKLPKTISIISSSSGQISPINPPLKLIKDQNVIFDLSDRTLSFTGAGTTYPAFKFAIYTDEELKETFNTTFTSTLFDVSQTGIIGVDTTAEVSLSLKSSTPKNLYYNLIPIDSDLNPISKKEIIRDREVIDSNKIFLVESGYNGTYSVVGVDTNKFQYTILSKPEIDSYTNNATIEYYTNSPSTYGPIQKISITDGGKHSVLPGISSINSILGSNAILKIDTSSIGKVLSTEIEDIGFDYSADYSIRPIAKLPDILTLESSSTIEHINVVSSGKNYTSPPNLIVLDGTTNKIINDVKLKYSLGDTSVNIIKNSSSLSNVTPIIIPTNNTNGINIKNIVFDESTKDVTVTLGSSFSSYEDFPFEVGGKVLVEGVSISGSEGKGYNSSKYNYTLFTITSIDENISGENASIVYNLSSLLKGDEVPGTFNSFYSSGRIIPESQFPIFDVKIRKGIFYKGETAKSNSAEGIVESWDPNNQYLKISTTEDFIIGQNVYGKTSGSVGKIIDIAKFDIDCKISSFASRRKGWNKETGFLNNDFQRIHDSDYYQYFSYALKSKKDFTTWDNPVSNLNHTAGFKKFSDLIIESNPTNSGIKTDQNEGDFTGISDLVSIMNLNCVSDFDLAKENNLLIDEEFKSNEIAFNSRIIQDYIESIGNRVLVIDDISNQFDSTPRSSNYSIVDKFDINQIRSKKYIITIQDKRFTDEKQTSLVTLVHNNNTGFLNQYGMEVVNLGFFDFEILGTVGNLLFYPSKFKYNDYHALVFSFSLSDLIDNVGTLDLGNSCVLKSNSAIIPENTSNEISIVGISSTYRSSKILVQIGSTTTPYFELDEITYIHDGNQVYITDYGQITTNTLNFQSTSGIGTYNAYISNDQVKLDLIPYQTTEKEYIVNSLSVCLSDENVSGIGSEIIGGSLLNSNSVSIPSSSSPNSTIISTYSNMIYNSSYILMSISDKTNSDYQISEFINVSNSNVAYSTEFGQLYSSSPLGITTVGIDGDTTNIYFTPIENIDVDVKIFQVGLGLNQQTNQSIPI